MALTMFDLKRRGLVGRLGLCGVSGSKFPAIRAHMRRAIANTYANLRDIVLGAEGSVDGSTSVDVETFPADTCSSDPLAYKKALLCFSPGDVAIIFTPDNTHFDIAMACVERGLHVLVTKPIVQTLAQHILLAKRAAEHGVLVGVEVHKRLDPIYVDARDKIQQSLGPFSYMHAYMSQPKYQLDTFRAWAGRDSDISYYLNSHHVDFHEWCVGQTARPISVTALASTGVASQLVEHKQCEDTITLSVQWEVFPPACGDADQAKSSLGSASYTASWIAPKAEVHSQQRFFYMGHGGEVNVDQAHRGYGMAADVGLGLGEGFKSLNPLFMKYTPNRAGHFVGQLGYGYRSFEAFIQAASSIGRGESTAQDYNELEEEIVTKTESKVDKEKGAHKATRSEAGSVATIHDTYRTTAILEAGRRSLDLQCTVYILYNDNDKNKRSCIPVDLVTTKPTTY